MQTKSTSAWPHEVTCSHCGTPFMPNKFANKRRTIFYCTQLCKERARTRDLDVKRAADREYGMRPENREKRRERARRWREDNAHRLSEYKLSAYMKWKYGITQEQYEQMVVVQEERCAICGGDDFAPWGRLVVDHDHATGAVRGLLCHGCNACIGQAKDDVAILRKAVVYLERFA